VTERDLYYETSDEIFGMKKVRRDVVAPPKDAATTAEPNSDEEGPKSVGPTVSVVLTSDGAEIQLRGPAAPT
jgi:hypothetical protein